MEEWQNLTRILVSETGPGVNWRVRAVVVRDSGNSEDLIKRASFLEMIAFMAHFQEQSEWKEKITL